MKILTNKNQAFAIFLSLGFFVGILYQNIVSSTYNISFNSFQEFYLKQYSQTNIVTEDYLAYITRMRGMTFLTVCILGCMKWKKVIAAGCIGWTGFLAGIITVQAVLWLGIKGIFLCLTAMFPQMIFYGLAYMILFFYLYDYPVRKWNMQMTLFAGAMLVIGILFEAYLNPILLKGFIKIFA